MSRSVNRVILVGNAGSDPDVRETQGGTRVAHVSLATNRLFSFNGRQQEKTEWHRLTFWGKRAGTVENYLRKGTRIYVEGRIEYGSYDRDGVSVPTTDVVVRDFVFLDPGPAARSETWEEETMEGAREAEEEVAP